MSAIYGIFNKNGDPVKEEQLSKLQHAMRHRTTGGAGVWKSSTVAFGFCKLVAHSRQEKEQLPVETDDLVLTADARIDNREELYGLLSLNKHKWQTEADSYLILKAYQKWGESCVDYLGGEFAFAIWNKVNGRLFIATDQIGFRPIYYYDGPDVFVFCSEIKGIEAIKTTPNYFSHQYFVNHQFRQGDWNLTFNKEIFALGGGNIIVLSSNKIQLKNYWTLKNRGKYSFSKTNDWIECMRDLFQKAVEKRVDLEQPVGITLSGGLDSSGIACILAPLLEKRNKPLYAFSSVLPLHHIGIEVDERKYIEKINKHCPNIIQTFVDAPGLGPFDEVEQAFQLHESMPNVFSYMDIAILSAAQQQGVRNLFTGYGGDFWVSWKGRTALYMLMQQGNYNAALKVLKQTAEMESKSKLGLIRRNYLSHTKVWKLLRKLKQETKLNWQEYTTLHPEYIARYNQEFDFASEPNQNKSMQKMLRTGRISFLTGLFATRNAAYGMESSLPMFDKDVLEFLIEVPIALFNHNGWPRGLFRHAMDGILPPEVQWRKDKLPYNPNFTQRLIDDKESLYAMMKSDKYKFIFDDYLSKEIISRHFDEIKPFAGFSGETSATGIRMAQAGIAYKTLAYLYDNNYQF